MHALVYAIQLQNDVYGPSFSQNYSIIHLNNHYPVIQRFCHG